MSVLAFAPRYRQESDVRYLTLATNYLKANNERLEMSYIPLTFTFIIKHQNRDLQITARPLDKYGDEYTYERESGIEVPYQQDKSSIYQIARRKTMELRDQDDLENLKAEYPHYTENPKEIINRLDIIERRLEYYRWIAYKEYIIDCGDQLDQSPHL